MKIPFPPNFVQHLFPFQDQKIIGSFAIFRWSGSRQYYAPFSLSINPNFHQKCENLKGKNLKTTGTPETPEVATARRRRIVTIRTTQVGRRSIPRTTPKQPI